MWTASVPALQVGPAQAALVAAGLQAGGEALAVDVVLGCALAARLLEGKGASKYYVRCQGIGADMEPCANRCRLGGAYLERLAKDPYTSARCFCCKVSPQRPASTGGSTGALWANPSSGGAARQSLLCHPSNSLPSSPPATQPSPGLHRRKPSSPPRPAARHCSQGWRCPFGASEGDAPQGPQGDPEGHRQPWIQWRGDGRLQDEDS